MGNQPQLARFLTPYIQKLIKRKAKQLCRLSEFTTSDREDIAQDLTLALLKQAGKYDPSRASIDTFGDRVINNAVRMLLRHRRRKIRAEGFRTLSLSTVVFEADSGAVTLGDVITDGDNGRRLGTTPRDPDLERDVAEAMELLPPDLRILAEALTEDCPAHAAKKLGISRSTVYDRVKQIRKRFERAGFGNQRT